nr:unnamed protein product [Callosobruchus analis]
MDVCKDTKLIQFASLITKLKALLNLNVIQEAVELECHHKLCNTCYHDLSEARLTCCPICKTTSKKRCSPCKDNYTNAVGRFVSVIDMQFQSVYQQKVEKLAASSHIKTSKVSKFFQKINDEIETDKPSKENVDKRELPITEVKTSEYLKTKSYNQNLQVNSQHSSECDPFDRLLKKSKDTLKFNRKSARNVYTNRKKGGIRDKENKVLDFEDDKNKEAVLNWLNDTRNQFDRLTQTQGMVPSANDELMNLPSVSQPNIIETQRKRAKSLDLENGQNIVKSKRYSYNYTSDHDNYNIEDTNTEGIISEEKIIERAKENVILHLLEDELLDKMDQEVVPPDRITCDKEIKEKKSDIVGISLASCNSGWTRITEMKETVDKSGKVPKQLRIILQCKEKDNCRKKEPACLEQHKDHNLSGAKVKQHNVKHVVDHSKKIEFTNNSPVSKSCKASAHVMINSHINDKTNMLPENESGDPPTIGTSHRKNNLKKSDKRLSLEHEKNLHISLNNNEVKNTKTSKPCIVDQTIIAKTGQHTLSSEVLLNHDNPNDKSDEDLDDYDLPTQTILGVDDSNKLRHSTNKLLSYINEYIQICSKESDSNCALEAIDRIKAYVGRLKQINVVNASVQTSPLSKKDVCVETRLQTCNKAVETLGISKNTCSVQTSGIRQRDATSQTEPLRSEESLKSIQDRPQRKYQMLDRDGTKATSNKNQESEASGNIENELFTNSLDNVDFNTLEVVKNSSSKIDSGADVGVKGDFGSLQKCDIHQKEVETITTKSYFGATTSNQKRSRDESEIEDMAIPKKKCNRFIMTDVLSVEFDNTLDKEETQERESHGESSIEKNHNKPIPSANIEKINSYGRASEKHISIHNTEDPREKNQGFKIKRPTKYLDKYDEIIAKVSENVERLTKQAQIARETNQQPIEKNNSPIRNVSTTKLEEFKEQFPGYSSDIISGTESISTSPKKRKVKSSNVDIDTNISETNKVVDTKECMEVCHELEDSFDEEFANIHFSADNEDKPKVKILADVKIKSQDNKGKVVDDDLFSDDEDVVETTPPNRSPAIRDVTDIGLGPDRIIEDEENLDFPALPPPLAFQDGVVHEVDTDETLKPDDSHLLSSCKQDIRHSTSDFLCLINVDSPSNQQEEKPIENQVKNMIHSTPKTSKDVSTYTLGFSPIKENSVSQATPSVGKNIQKRNILTSTPRQISMWNYVKPSQSPQKATPVSSNSATDITAIEVINSKSNQVRQAAEDMKIVPKKPCIAFTRLNKDQVMCISQMTNKKLATHTMTFNKNVTHMIVTVDKNGWAKDYTVKFMAAIASGIWVLKFDWVQKCLDTNTIEPYEALDDTGGQGPKNSRLTRLEDPLLRNFRFYIPDPLVSTTHQEIEDIIKLLGGWLEQYKVVTIDIEWLSKSIGRYKQISFRPYILCSDETLDELNYPDHLVENVPYSVDP